MGLARELGPPDISVGAIAPSVIEADMVTDASTAALRRSALGGFLGVGPQARTTSPVEGAIPRDMVEAERTKR